MIFFLESKSEKKNLFSVLFFFVFFFFVVFFFFCFFLGGRVGGEGARVIEIFFTKNPN